MVWKKFGVSCDPGSTLTLLIILCDIQVTGEQGWRRFVSDGRRDFTDYSTVVSPGWQLSSSRPWPQRPVSRWLTHRSLQLKKLRKLIIVQGVSNNLR
ncbi:hypothetical protein Hanom_Chr15g01381741 [Helianthus anomalus]